VCLSGIVNSEEVFSLIEKFAAAVFLEREIYELFGINFKKNNSDSLTSERMFVFSEGVQNPMLKAKV
jgi:NADH:ubiquinone oxidoreductase subunit C